MVSVLRPTGTWPAARAVRDATATPLDLSHWTVTRYSEAFGGFVLFFFSSGVQFY